MAEAIAPPQSSFLDKVGDVFRGMRTGGISLESAAPAGAVAPVAEPAISSAATPVVQAAPKAIVTSSALPSLVTQKDRNLADTANADGSAKALVSAAAQADTAEAQKALMLRANNAAKGDAQYADTLGQVDAKGGLQSPDGRLKYAQLWQNRDNTPQYTNAFIQYALGNSKAAKKYLSGGEVSDQVKIDTTTGDAIKYGVDENGDYHWAINQTTGKQLSPEEFNKVIGRLGTLDQSIAYQQQKDNAKEWTQKFNADVENANTTGAAAQALHGAYETYGNLLRDLKDISPALASEISRYGTQVIGTTAAQSKAAQAFSQKAQEAGLKKGDTVTAGLAAGFEGTIPKLAGAKFNGNGEFTATDGTTFNINQLSQGTASANTSSEMDKRFTASAQDLIKDAKIQALMAQDPSGRAAKQFTAALDMAKSIALQEAKVGSNAFNLPTVGFGVTDEFARGRVQAEQGMFNQKANAAYAKYANDMTKQFGPGQAPRPGELIAGFTASPEYKVLLKEYKTNANKIIKEQNEYAPRPEGAGISQASAAPAIPSPAPNESLARQYGTGSTVAAPVLPTSSKTPAGSVTPPAATELPKGIPSGSVDTGKYAKGTNKKVYRAPNGTLHVED